MSCFVTHRILEYVVAMNKNKPYRVESVRSWDEYSEKVGELCHGWGFRGHADSTWPLMSTLGRYLNAYVKEKYWTVQEERIARIFQRKAHLFLTHIPERSDTFQWLALMQHHGAPTRLLDFTWSPYVAAFFALVQTTAEGVIWACNPVEIERMKQVDLTKPGNFRKRLLSEAANFVWLGEPYAMNRRLIAQSGTFLVPAILNKSIEEILKDYPNPKQTLIKFILPANRVREKGMREL